MYFSWHLHSRTQGRDVGRIRLGLRFRLPHRPSSPAATKGRARQPAVLPAKHEPGRRAAGVPH